MKTPRFVANLINTSFLWLLVAVGIVSTILLGFKSSSSRLSDFVGYYTSAQVVAGGDSLSSLYDDTFFVERVTDISPSESTFVMYVNPPAVSFLMLPLHNTDPLAAKLIWNWFSVLLVVASFFLVCRYLGLPYGSRLAPLLLGMLASTLPFFRNLQRGQVYVLMLLLVLVFMIGYRERNPWLAGIPLAILLLLKYFGWMFLILFLVERRWKDLSIALFSLLVGSCVALMVVGPSTYVAHIHYLLAVFERNDFASTGLPSMQALFGALFTRHPQFNPNPIGNVPWLAQALTLLALMISLYVTMRKTRVGHNSHEYQVLSILTLSVVFTPLAADHHYMLIIPSAFLMIMTIAGEDARWVPAILAFVFLYALLGWYPSLPIARFDGLGKLFCFLRLYAAIGLWLFLVSKCKSGAVPNLLSSHERL